MRKHDPRICFSFCAIYTGCDLFIQRADQASLALRFSRRDLRLPYLRAAGVCDGRRRGALDRLLACALGAVFVALVGSAVYRQMNIKCGCFLSNDSISAATVVRSTLVLFAAFIGLVLSIQVDRSKALA